MNRKCFLCKSGEDNELLFGKFYSKWKLTVHYYCLLLSSNLVQRGSNDTVGIFGFLEADIRKENERTKKCRCYICKDMHANVSCCSKKCLRTFHTVCGIMNGCLSHYTDTYQSWCSAHVPLEPDSRPHSRDEPCSICYDEMGQYDVITSIKAPCCRNGWFHQGCLAQYAQSAGYFFKCPLCKNEDKFLTEIPLRGVFVPERDAAWELEPNAFQEQLLRPTACDADDCKCQEGRSVDNRQWRLVVCRSCGSTCRHRQCMEQTNERSRLYLCQLCRPIVGESIPVLETTDDSGDSNDDAASTSTNSSVGRALQGRARTKISRAGSGESGVHCSSNDETLGNIRRLKIARRISSDGSDSDASSIQIRRCIRQNTGKRVRRLMSDGSDNAQSNETTEHTHVSDAPEGLVASKQLEGNSDATDPLPTFFDCPPSVRESDENSCSSSTSKADVRSRRSFSRRLSALSDTSKQSASESIIEEPGCTSSVTRRPIIYSSSDECKTRSRCAKRNSQATNDMPRRKEHYSARQLNNKPSSSTQTRRPRISSSSDDSEKRSDSENNMSYPLNRPSISKESHVTSQRNSKSIETERTDPSTSCSRGIITMENTETSKETSNTRKLRKQATSPQSYDSSKKSSCKRWDENSNMTGTVSQGESRSPPASKNGENLNASDTSSGENIVVNSTRKLTRRLSLNDAGKRTTSESSMDMVRPKGSRTARISTIFDDSDKQTEDLENCTTDKVDWIPQNKRRRLTRVRCNKTNQKSATERHIIDQDKTSSISPPSTPSSLASETSQKSVANNSNTSKSGVMENAKHSSGDTPNRQQQSMLRFLTFSSRKSAISSDSSDLSTEEARSPSGFTQLGSNKQMERTKVSSISSKCTKTTTKRRRSHSPKTSNNRSHKKQEAETVPTSSKASVQSPNKRFMHKDKGQKNILNYFNRY